ncbi:MAG: translation initiation factor IF-3 [Deltaproteobacteria bacterium]|nr:translation initiation factor IF-3 [Deltaproteobacteria bacterium]
MRPGEFRGRSNRLPPSQSKSDKHHINSDITAPEVRVIGADGAQLGVLKTREAIAIAEEQGLDLVEVAHDATPPVCRILDYGKLRYKEQKKASEARKKSSTHVTKELRVRYSTDKHDLETKVKHARKFLGEGDKVRFEMRFRGREVVYQELGKDIFKQIAASLQDVGIVEESTPLLGYKMTMSFAPKGHVAPKA